MTALDIFGTIGCCVACICSCCNRDRNRVDAEPTDKNTDDRDDSWGTSYLNGSGPHFAATNWASETHSRLRRHNA